MREQFHVTDHYDEIPERITLRICGADVEYRRAKPAAAMAIFVQCLIGIVLGIAIGSLI